MDKVVIADIGVEGGGVTIFGMARADAANDLLIQISILSYVPALSCATRLSGRGITDKSDAAHSAVSSARDVGGSAVKSVPVLTTTQNWS